MKDIRIHLMNAYNNRDEALLEQICRDNENLIFQHFQDWLRVPASIREDEQLTQLYVNTLVTVARFFDSLGRNELMDLLQGDSASNPVVQLNNMYARANSLFREGAYEESKALLQQLLSELKPLKGSAVEDLYPKVYGLLGNNFLKLDQIERARENTHLALTKCIETGDFKGETIYRKNLRLMEAYAAYTADVNSPLITLRKKIVNAQKLSDKGNYALSNELLDSIASKITRSEDPRIKEYAAKIYGLLGLNYYRLGQLTPAKSFTEKAIELSQNDRDRVGVIIYRNNLKTITGAE